MSEYCDRLTLWLLGCCVVSALMIMLELLLPVSLETMVKGSGEDPVLPQLPQSERYVPATMAAYSTVLEQPIFFRSRKMPEVAVEPTAPPAPLRLRLEGIAVSGDSRVAVLRNLADNQLLQLAPGSVHDGWRLTSVDPGSATFERDGRATVVALEISEKRRR